MKVTIKNVCKKYDNVDVLKINELAFKENKINAIIGPNGAGKSTLINIIGNLISKDEGTILFDDSEVFPNGEVTVVFQSPHLIDTTVKKNLLYPLKIRKYDKKECEKRVNDLSEQLNIQSLLNKKAHQLSLGEKQKVALARALIFNPKVLLLDEPSASIDPFSNIEIESILKEINNTTIILISHNLAQVKRIADYVILLNHGEVIESNDKDKFFNQPEKELTKKFIEGEFIV
ncbi:MAG: ABC transporter ATP-binding protein [Bacilli bacterium]|nr:ABC transporter ATP-binding protein [Bacilli bacterium]